MFFGLIGTMNIPNKAIRFDATIDKIMASIRYFEGGTFIKSPLSLIDSMLTGMLNTIVKKAKVFVCSILRCSRFPPTKSIRKSIQIVQNKPNKKEVKVNFFIFHFSGLFEYSTLSVAKEIVIKSLKKNMAFFIESFCFGLAKGLCAYIFIK